ncbi:hypothetical protein SteCoe_22307 [Stentor coeruleus]|uniref:Uncharacterized protein n=1 Tax=Stentor coeruleus TaxID=5963 RepID=A0A1R2BML1_9CILI|nr:hypothetical protein SteCoe_22307 [Stentor coeruleus]
MSSTWDDYKRARLLPHEERHTIYSPFFHMMSFKKFEKTVLPIISDNPKDQGLKIYEDKRLPYEIRLPFQECKQKLEKEFSILSFISIWMISKITMNIYVSKKSLGRINLFDKRVLGLSLPLWIFATPYVIEGMKYLPLVDVDDLLFADRKNKTLGTYRKKLIETYPELVRMKYLKDKELQAFDDVKIFIETIKETKKDEENTDSGELLDEELTESEIEYLKQNQGIGEEKLDKEN